jgi:quercetin dioxygenase-like cupin family protein
MSKYFLSPNELSRHAAFPGVVLRTCSGKHMTLSEANLEAGAVVAEHSHPHEQMGIIIQGRARFWIGDEEKVLGPGDVFRIPGGVRHKVTVLDQPARIIDVFHPVREEYR